MKKLTKKVISEQPSYIVQVDWRSDYRPGFSYLTYFGELFGVLKYAEREYTGDVYMLSLYERSNEISEDRQGLIYIPRLASRKAGKWHLLDQAHCENPDFILVYYPDLDYTSVIYRG